MKMKTIKQIAETLGIDKQRVYRYICRNHITPVHREAGTMYYDDVAESLINTHFTKDEAHRCTSKSHQTASSDTVIETVISMLQRELDIKNKQILELTTALESTTASLQVAQALHVGTIKQLVDGSVKSRCVESVGEPLHKKFLKIFLNRFGRE